MARPTLHLIGIFHTQASDAFSHCAFTGKAQRFPRMLREQGWRVIEYANAGSCAEPDEHVPMLSTAEFEAHYGGRDLTAFHGDDAVIGSAGHRLFEERLIEALRERLRPGDIVCHPFGHAHQALLALFPEHDHVETGIGYPTLMKGSWKVFESYAWMHWHQGREQRQGRNYEWVIPNAYDPADWDVIATPGTYLAFLGRICAIKGMDTLRAIADHSRWPIHIAGQGDPTAWRHPNLHYRGVLHGRQRSAFLGGARAVLMPSQFTEPFAGAGVEAQLCGTPLIGQDYGAFTETIEPGLSGFRCHTLAEWLAAIEAAGHLDRRAIAERARARYSLETCGPQYSRVFEAIAELRSGGGWYALPHHHRIAPAVAAAAG
jgi:glycosyltransferase involved in cell wall biosynthesis